VNKEEKIKKNNNILKNENNIQLDSKKLKLSEQKLKFHDMKMAYIKNLEKDGLGVSSFQSDEYLALATLWVDAYSKAAGVVDAGMLAFESEVGQVEFDLGMQIVKKMQGSSIDEVARKITIEFGFNNPFAIEAILYFISSPKVSKMFNIDCSQMMAETAAENVKDKILSENNSKDLKILKELNMLDAQMINVQDEEKVEVVQNNDQKMVMPQIVLQDFSPRQMYDYYGNVDYDGKNLIIIGPDGERIIEEKPDERLEKIAMMNRIWKTTCFNMEPDPDDERLEEIARTLFVGDNALILDKISKIFVDHKSDKAPNVDEILRNLSTTKGVQECGPFIHKAYDFLSNLSQFGGLELDFKGVQPRKYYIDLVNQNNQEMER